MTFVVIVEALLITVAVSIPMRSQKLLKLLGGTSDEFQEVGRNSRGLVESTSLEFGGDGAST
jgi:hypothetical protein